jgi:CheY-like chemotaxis protein
VNGEVAQKRFTVVARLAPRRVYIHSMGEDTPLVIVGEDDDDLRRDYGDWLSDEGYSVLLAANGLELIELARMHMPALLVIKHDLPGLDGWEVTRAVRRDPRLQATKIVSVMTLAERWMRRHERKLGGSDTIILAPCTPPALTVAVRNLVPVPDEGSLIRMRVAPVTGEVGEARETRDARRSVSWFKIALGRRR